MRFEKLWLKAYGPFENTLLDFTGYPGLQIVYGENEAGKSSCLRAITALLFGIHGQTSDNFRHDYPALRIGAVLNFGAGEKAAIMRRKGNKATLFEYDPVSGREHTETPLAMDFFSARLGNLTEATFRTLFGIDHRTLRAGGRELLEGRGEVGQTLFQASGLAGIGKLLDELRLSAAELYTPRSSKAALNAATRDYEAAAKRLKDTLIRPQEWKDRSQALAEANAKATHLDTEIRQLRAEEQRLVRLQATLPQITERLAFLGQLQALSDVPLLDPAAPQRRAALENTLATSETDIHQAEGLIAHHEQELNDLQVSATLLAAGPDIEALRHDLKRAAEAKSKLQIAEARYAENDRILAALFRQLNLAVQRAALPDLLPGRAHLIRVRTLGKDLAVQAEQLAKAQEQVQDRQRKLEAARQGRDGLPPPFDLSRLAATLETLARSGDLEARAREIATDVAVQSQRLEAEARALGLTDSTQLRTLQVPLDAEVAQYAEALADLHDALSTLDGKEADLTRDLDTARAEMSGLSAAGTVVTAEVVAAARRDRDAQWNHLRATFIDALGGQCPPPPGTLPDTYETAVDEADRRADELRADTARATEYASLAKRCEQMAAALETVRANRADILKHEARQRAAWAERLTALNLAVLSPEAFKGWLAERRILLQRLEQIEARIGEQRQTGAAIAAAREALVAAWQAANLNDFLETPSLSVAVTLARQAVAANDAAANARYQADSEVQRLAEELREAGFRLTDAERRQEKLRDEWSRTLTVLHLDGTASPVEAEARIDHLEALASAWDNAERLTQSIALERSFLEQHEALATRIASALGRPIPAPEAIASFAETCHGQLETGRTVAQRRKELQELLHRERDNLERARFRRTDAERQLAELVAAANCGDRQGLPEAEFRSEQRRTAETRVTEIGQQLTAQWRMPLETLLQEAAGARLEDVEASLDAVRPQLQELEETRTAARESVAEARRDLQEIHGDAEAAEIREEMESLLARIRHDAEQFVRLRLASLLLDRTIQQFRERSRGPLLLKAQGYFSLLTGGRYDKLSVDFQDEGRQVLVAERPNDSRLHVDAMSEGTADQLYLSLRLASIELALESGPTIPVILDDVLLTFDDRRATFALNALAKLGESTQVLLFTHHQHVIDLARSALPAESFGLIRLVM